MKLFNKPETARIIVMVIAAVTALTLGLSALFGVQSTTIMPGPEQLNEAIK